MFPKINKNYQRVGKGIRRQDALNSPVLVKVDFLLINGDDSYASKLILEIPRKEVKSAKDIMILAEEYLEKLVNSEIKITNANVLKCENII